MTAEEYRALAAEFRRKAGTEESPAFRAELKELARCYEWAATAAAEPSADHLDKRDFSWVTARNNV
jgi:hypothetical protein